MDLFKEWPSWNGADGKPYQAGDTVAVATLQYKSPVMHIGTVVRINRVDSKGNPHGHETLDQGDPRLEAAFNHARSTLGWDSPETEEARRNWHNSKNRVWHDGCTVTVRVNGSSKDSTYKNANNIVKLS